MDEQAPRQAPDAEYEVGYGKPPKHTRFQPGQSGNKKGRPRKSKSIRTLARDMLNEKIEITEGGVRKNIKKSEAIVRKLFTSAMKGDQRAAKTLMELQGLEEAPTAASENDIMDVELNDILAFADWAKGDLGSSPGAQTGDLGELDSSNQLSSDVFPDGGGWSGGAGE